MRKERKREKEKERGRMEEKGSIKK